APPASRTAGFRLLGSRYVVIDGFTIVGAGDAGIQVRVSATRAVNSSDVTIRNVTVRDGGKRGIDISAEDGIVIERSTVLGNGSTGISVEGCRPGSASTLCSQALSTPGEEAPKLTPRLSNNVVGRNGSHGIF